MPRPDLELAHALATTAADLALPFFRKAVSQDLKLDGTFVREVDHLVERSILETLSIERPNDRVLAEETGEHGAPEATRRWIIDPLDMTETFLRGKPGWGTHITLEVDGRIEVAIITRPVPDLRWWAVRGEGAYRSSGNEPLDQSTRLQVSSHSTLAGANVGGFTRPDSRARKVLADRATWVSDRFCIVGAMAEGRLDAFVDDGGKAWDLAPAVLIIEEAGGTFFDPDGGNRFDLGWGLYTNQQLSVELYHHLITST